MSLEKSKYYQIEQDIIEAFGVSRKQLSQMNYDDINNFCISAVSYIDEDRISTIGNILLYLIINIDSEIPANMSLDLFSFSIYPDIYPVLEDWQEYELGMNDKLISKEAQWGKKTKVKQDEILSKISQKQATAIFNALVAFFKKHPGIVYEDLEIALIFYWQARAQGNSEFSI